MQSLITFWASIKGRYPTYCNSRSDTSQIHTADQLPTILFIFEDSFIEIQQIIKKVTIILACFYFIFYLFIIFLFIAASMLYP